LAWLGAGRSQVQILSPRSEVPARREGAGGDLERRLAQALQGLTGVEGGLRRAAQQFADRPGSECYAAGEVEPEVTWQRVTEELARVSVIAAVEGARDRDLTVDIGGAVRGIAR